MSELVIILAAILGPLLLTVGIAYLALRYVRQKTLRAQARARELVERQRQAVWAGATIITVRHSELTAPGQGEARVDLRLKVTPPAGEAYQATTVWLVDLAALPQLQPGQSVSVGIDPEDSTVIYPNLSGARYLGGA